MRIQDDLELEVVLERLGIGCRKTRSEVVRRRRLEARVHEAAGRRQWRLLERRLGEEVRKAADLGPGDWLDEERDPPGRGAARARGR